MDYHAWVHRLAILSVLGAAALLGLSPWPVVFWVVVPLPLVGEMLGWVFANKTWSFKMKFWDTVSDLGEYWTFPAIFIIFKLLGLIHEL